MDHPAYSIPADMLAAVYEAPERVTVRRVPVPEIGPGELLVKVEACGICGTDLKKISHGLQAPPRIYGHEFAGTVVAAGGVSRGSRGSCGSRGAPWPVGRRVAVYHHVPCRKCYLCRRGAYSQCAFYKKTGTTAGYEPAGGGWAQYVRVMDWIARDGVVAVPDGVSSEHASLMEPLNTCLKCVKSVALRPGELVAVLGQGPIGLMLTQLCKLADVRVVAVDLMPSRLELAKRYGACAVANPAADDVPALVASMSDGGGADAVFVATPNERAVRSAIDMTRPAGRVMLFAQTEKDQTMALPVGQVCVLEKWLLGSYSSSIDLNDEVARLLFDGVIPAGDLVTHRFALAEISEAIALARRPDDSSLKIVVMPGMQ